MDRMNPVDSVFLDAEDADPHVSLAIASVAVLAGPTPSQAEFVAAIAPRMRAVRRAQRRVRRLPFDLSPPVWVDLGDFDTDYHFRRTALPAPGDDTALCALVARVMGQRLDRDRPLLESWVIEGLSGGRWAVLTKLHHCLADGISGAQLLAALFAATPRPIGEPQWQPEPRPSAGTLLWDAAGELATNSLRLLTHAIQDPKDVVRRVADKAAGINRMAEVLAPAKESSLCGPIGRSRRYAVARASLPAMREIGTAFGATVNDVALTAITMGFREILRHRGERPDANTLRTAVPVSVRVNGNLDNQISVLLPTLPVAIAALAGQEAFTLSSLAVRLAVRLPQRNITTVTTNVPGPPTRLEILSRPVLEVLPYVPIAVRLRTGVAALSYRDHMTFGVTDPWTCASGVNRPHGTTSSRARFANSVRTTLNVASAAMLDIYLSDMNRVVEDVGLSDSAHKLGGEPSGGQRNQLSLAVAVLGLLLADGSPNELRDRIGSRPGGRSSSDLSDRGQAAVNPTITHTTHKHLVGGFLPSPSRSGPPPCAANLTGTEG